MAIPVYFYCRRCRQGRTHLVSDGLGFCTECGLVSGGVVRRKRLRKTKEAP